jgi:hypothetical protein
MRKRPTNAVKSEDVLSLPDVVKKLEEIDERTKQLEAEVFGGGASILWPPPVKRGKGRRPLLEEEVLLERRDHLTNWMERNWPYLSVALRKAKNSHEAIAAIIKAATGMSVGPQSPFYRDAEKFEAALWRFLKSGRFHGNPRNLAGAMAGLPELSWKRSFDRCSGHPCKIPVAIEAYWDYMRRHFPDRLRELQIAKTEERVKAVLKKSRTHDPVYLCLKKNPGKALDWLKAGKPPESTPNLRQTRVSR